MPKQIAILGSTGWIGRHTLQVVRQFPSRFSVAVLAAKSNIDLLFEQAQEFSPECIAIFDPEKAKMLQNRLPHIPILAGLEGLQQASAWESVEFVMLALSGAIALFPAVSAIHAGKTIGIANKESIVSGGRWLLELAIKKGAKLIPVDSEHAALHQCLRAGKKEEVRRLILTASGGSLLHKTKEEMRYATLEETVRHPHWTTGPKSMVDCATLMNKGLEMIEASYLFDIAPDRIEAVIHPESQIQSCVEFVDGSVIAQIAEADMTLPIQYALAYPERLPNDRTPYDFFKNGKLHFSPPDLSKFPCLNLAISAMKAGKSYPCFLNAANEVLVEHFLEGKIPFFAIGEKLEKLIASHRPENMITLEAILAIDQHARELAKNS